MLKVIIAIFTFLKGAKANSPAKSVNTADWISTLRVQIYVAIAMILDTFVEQLQILSDNPVEHTTVEALVIGVVLSAMELARRYFKDYDSDGKPPEPTTEL